MLRQVRLKCVHGNCNCSVKYLMKAELEGRLYLFICVHYARRIRLLTRLRLRDTESRVAYSELL